jgi:hypothetical protein
MSTIMKKTPEPYKTRAHRVLFEHDSPFRARKVTLKNQYQRRPKHPKRETE